MATKVAEEQDVNARGFDLLPQITERSFNRRLSVKFEQRKF